MRAVQLLDRLVHQALQPLADLVDALDVPAVLVQVRERDPRGLGAGQDLLGLLLHLGVEPVVLGPAVRVRLVQVEIRAVEVARPARVPLAAHGVRRALDRGRVHVTHPVAQGDDCGGRRACGLVEFRPQGVGAGRGEVLEPAAARTVRVRPLRELLDERRGGARARVQLALQAQGEGLAVAVEGRRYGAQSLGDGGPVLVRVRGRHGEHLAHRVHGGMHVADGPQALLGVVHAEFGGEPLAEQACAAALDVTVRAGLPLRLVEPRQCGAGERRERLLTGGRGVGQRARTLLHAEIRSGDRVEGDELVDVGVGDLAGQRVLRL